MAGSSGASDALKTFEMENDIRASDAIYRYDNAENQKNLAGKPWTKDPRYFKHVRISALALVKMVMHARSGGSLEIMGWVSAPPTPRSRWSALVRAARSRSHFARRIDGPPQPLPVAVRPGPRACLANRPRRVRQERRRREVLSLYEPVPPPPPLPRLAQPHAWQDRPRRQPWADDDCHGRVRSSRGGDRDARERAGGRVRVHGRVPLRGARVGSPRERARVVPFPPGLWLLALRD